MGNKILISTLKSFGAMVNFFDKDKICSSCDKILSQIQILPYTKFEAPDLNLRKESFYYFGHEKKFHKHWINVNTSTPMKRETIVVWIEYLLLRLWLCSDEISDQDEVKLRKK